MIILHARWADRKAWIAGAVPGFSLFSKIIKPRNRRPDSACSLHNHGKSMLNSKDLRNDKKTNRFILCAFSHDNPSMLFPAIAITRYPRFV